jgi:hypothetical protein
MLKMVGIRELPKSAPKTVRSVMDTMLLTPDGVARWKKPPFQRDFRLTPRVAELVKELKENGGVLSGVLTLGKLGADTYLVDGQHRIEAFKLSEMKEGIADVRICQFESMADMGDEFSRLNSALVRMRNDDILRGLEGSNGWLAEIRKRCAFVGYSNIRMGGGNSPLIAMASAVRIWFGSAGDTPTAGPSSTESAKLLDEENTSRLIKILSICFEAWGREKENHRLWGSLNLSLVFWLWRRLVLKEGANVKRRGGIEWTTLNNDQFRLCLMALGANKLYVEWLLGRGLRDRDRSPAYNRAKAIFAGRLGGMGIGRPFLPIPEWASH